MIIKIDNINIEFSFVTPHDNFLKYQTNENPKYIFNFKVGDIIIPDTPITLETEFYNLHNNIQIQYLNNIPVGKIEYLDNIVNITMKYKDEVLEYLLAQYAFFNTMNKEGKYLLMHGSSIKYKDHGIIFTAKSGVGKSTHVNYWINNTEAVIINDDKNLLKIEDEQLYFIPNPFSGKHYRDSNTKAKVSAIVFVKRDLTNHVEDVNPKVAFKFLLGQLDAPKMEYKDTWQEIVNKLLKKKLYDLYCTNSIEALNVMKSKIEEDLLNETN